jgi:acyl-coenzyme A synthetase/AMP-(fatty) acid ligase
LIPTAEVIEKAIHCGDVSGNFMHHTQLAGNERAPFMATTTASFRPDPPTYKGKYFTGDGCRRDDNYWWITGRVDDVINVSGHHGARRVESLLVLHDKVAEQRSSVFTHQRGRNVITTITLNAGESTVTI